MPYLAARNPLADAKDTLSSWDKCMAKTYCKWPVIVGIVLGSLIILSVVFCVARCICCAGEAACCCIKCCTCCCPSGGGRGHKRVNSGQHEPPPMPAYPNTYQPPIPPPAIDSRPINQQYRSHAAPAFTAAPTAATGPPQFAKFDVSRKPQNDDALPAMPQWDNAKTSHVEEEVIPEKRDDMELDSLNHNGSVTGTSVSDGYPGAAAVGAGRRAPARSPVHRSPTQVSNDSYGFPAGYHNDSFVNAGPQRGLHNGPGSYGQPYGQQRTDGYHGVSPIESSPQSLSPAYGGGAAYAQTQQYGRRSPQQGYDQQYQRHSPVPDPYTQNDQQYQRHSPAPEPYVQNAPRYSPTSPVQQDYGYNTPPQPQAHVAMPSQVDHQQHNPYAPAATAVPTIRTPSPNYGASNPPRHGSPAAAYPGQQPYEPAGGTYPGQQTYQAFKPS